MKKVTIAFALLLVFALSFAGIQDRSSWIQLVPHPGDYIKMPEVSSAPSTPDNGWGAVYATGNNIYFKSDTGVVTSMINGSDVAGAVVLNTVATFTDSDTTPDVTGKTYFNTNTTAVTITDFDGAGIAAGQLLVVTSKGAITYDVTSSGIKGGTTDIITAAGDVTTFLYDGTDWLVVARMDMSDDLN